MEEATSIGYIDPEIETLALSDFTNAISHSLVRLGMLEDKANHCAELFRACLHERVGSFMVKDLNQYSFDPLEIDMSRLLIESEWLHFYKGIYEKGASEDCLEGCATLNVLIPEILKPGSEFSSHLELCRQEIEDSLYPEYDYLLPSVESRLDEQKFVITFDPIVL